MPDGPDSFPTLLFLAKPGFQDTSVDCRRPDPTRAKEFLDLMQLPSPVALNGYMQWVLQVTSPDNVTNSPDAQRLRAAMISVTSSFMPLYDSIAGQTRTVQYSKQRKALLATTQRMFYQMYGTVKHMVRLSTQLQLSATDLGHPPQSARSDASAYSTEGEESPSNSDAVNDAETKRQKRRQKLGLKSGLDWDDSENERRCVFYSQGQLWPLVQLALADKTIQLKAGTVTTMSVMRAALPLVLRSTNMRHIAPIVTCMQRCGP